MTNIEEAQAIGVVLQALQVELSDVVKRAKETTQAESDLAWFKEENSRLREQHASKDSAWKRTVQRLNQENARLRNDNVSANVMIRSQRRRIQELESRGTLTEPSATEEALHDQVEKVRAYVKGLRIWGAEDKAQVCTDILYIIGENK